MRCIFFQPLLKIRRKKHTRQINIDRLKTCFSEQVICDERSKSVTEWGNERKSGNKDIQLKIDSNQRRRRRSRNKQTKMLHRQCALLVCLIYTLTYYYNHLIGTFISGRHSTITTTLIAPQTQSQSKNKWFLCLHSVVDSVLALQPKIYNERSLTNIHTWNIVAPLAMCVRAACLKASRVANGLSNSQLWQHEFETR